MTSSPTPAVLPDARALFLERLRLALPEWQREILDRVAASPDHYHGAAFPFTAMMAAVEATDTLPASDAAVPAGETETEVQRILDMSDDEILAEADVSDVAWARGFKAGMKTGFSAIAAAPKVASDTGAGLREAVARKLCEQHGGDPDAIATEEHDCWSGPLWSAFVKDADVIITLATPTDATDGETGVGEVGTGWVSWNPDSGEEYTPDHPVRSGECVEAQRIRPSTPQEDVLWQAFQGEFERAHALETQLTATTPGGDLLEQAARVADVEAIAAEQNCELGYRPAHNNGAAEVAKRIAARIRALKPAGDGGEA